MSSSDNQPAFKGHIADTLDALLVFEACKRGKLPRAQSRLTEAERRNIKSGDVYVFGEEESRIKRWTDGRRWSPSRIMNNFLVYRELEPSEKELKKSASSIPANNDSDNHDATARENDQASGSTPIQNQKKREESQNRSFGGDMFDDPPAIAAKEKVSQIPMPGIVLQGGLVKKTISVGGLHMISYYVPADLKTGSLKTPSSVPELASLEINHIFLLARYFRHPPQVTFGEDGMPRFVALTDDDPMPRKPGAAQPKKVKQEQGTSTSKQEDGRPKTGAGAGITDIAGPSSSFFPKMEPQDDMFPEEFGNTDSANSYMPSPPPPLPTNRRSSTGYSSGSRYRSVPGLARSLSSASDTATAAATGELSEHPPSMRPRTGSSSGGAHRHEPYRVPLSRGLSSSTATPSSTYHGPPSTANLTSPRHSLSLDHSPNATHLRHRNDVMYTEGIGRHLRSTSLSSGLGGGASRRGSMTSSPSIHAQISTAHANPVGGAIEAASPELFQHHYNPYFGSQHPHMSYTPYMAQQRPYTSPDGCIPEQAIHEGYTTNSSSSQVYAFPSQAQLDQQYNIHEDEARRMSMSYSPTLQIPQSPWSAYHSGGLSHPYPQQEQYEYPSLQSQTDLAIPATPSHTSPLQHSESIFMSGQQPYPMGEFVQPQDTSGQVSSEGGQHHMATNAIFQYYPPSTSSNPYQHTIPLPRTELSPLMPASASYPSLQSQAQQQSAEASSVPWHTPQVTEDHHHQQQHADLGIHYPAPPSYSHQQRETHPAHIGKPKIDYKVVEPVSWPTYTSHKAAQLQHQSQQYNPGVQPSDLSHPEYPDIS